MAPKGIKASKLFERKSKAKVIEWVAWKRSRGTQYIPVVKISPCVSQKQLRFGDNVGACDFMKFAKKYQQ